MFHQLNSVLIYTRDFISLNELPNLYQQLINQYQEAVNEPGNEEKIRVFRETKQKIVDVHKIVNYSAWSVTKLKILERIEAQKLIGLPAIETINNFFSEFAGTKTIEGLNTFKSETDQLLARINQTITNLSLSNEDKFEDYPGGIIEISFNDSAYQNFWKLGKRSESWQFIFNLFSRVTGENFEEVKIISAASGSDLSTIWIGGKKIMGMVIAASRVVVKLNELKDIFLKDKSELAGKFGFKKETIKLVLGERETIFHEQYEERKSFFSLEIVRELRGDKENDGENENELANVVGLGIEKMVSESGVGVKVLDPKEIKPTEPLAPDSLSSAYFEEAKIAAEVTQVIEDEKKEKALEQEEAMKKELTSQIEKVGLSALNEVKNKTTEKDEKKLIKKISSRKESREDIKDKDK